MNTSQLEIKRISKAFELKPKKRHWHSFFLEITKLVVQKFFASIKIDNYSPLIEAFDVIQPFTG